MSRSRKTSKRKSRKDKAAIGVAGVVSLLLTGAASAATGDPTAAKAPAGLASPAAVPLNEEEMVDASLSTFHLLDRETHSLRGLVKFAYCRGCGGCRCRGCRCAGCRF